MNKNMFAGPHFRPATSTAIRELGAYMGGLLDDTLSDLGIDDIDKYIDDLDKLIFEVPVGAVKDSYQKRRDECMDKNIVSKYTCLYDLFQDVKREIKDGGGSSTPPVKIPPRKYEPPATDWAWVPWAAGGLLAVGATYAIIQATKGKPKKGK